MFDIDKWQEIFSTIRANKLRAALTAFGVLWGICILILMLGFGNGLRDGVTRSMGNLATNAVFVWGRRASMPYQGMQPGRRVQFNNSDVTAIRRQVEGIEYLAPRNRLGRFRGGNTVSRGDKTGSFSIMGDYPEFQYIDPMHFTGGRFINELDIKERRKVAVIGSQVSEQLFDDVADPIGEHLEIQGIYFQIVGTFKPLQSGDAGDRQAQTIFIPFTTFQQAFNYGDRVRFFAITGRSDVDVGKLERDVRALLASRHRVAPSDEQAIGSRNLQQEFSKYQRVFAGMRGIIWVVGVMTLLAGMIGVINIMLITVKERTKEIGIRKALGATPRSIVFMIMQEAIVLTSLAGCLGILVGVGIIEWAAYQDFQSDTFAAPTVDFTVTLVATGILIVAGAIAGIIPAVQAATVDPVEALRAE